jgi:hypothetical protein
VSAWTNVIVANEAGLQRVLRDYLAYYLHSRTHLALDKDTPFSRPVLQASAGRGAATPQVGGYDRIAAWSATRDPLIQVRRHNCTRRNRCPS